MKYVYVLFEKSTFGEGDCVRAISTRKDTIQKEFNRYKKEYLNYENIGVDFDDNSVSIYYDDGSFVELQIQKHDLL